MLSFNCVHAADRIGSSLKHSPFDAQDAVILASTPFLLIVQGAVTVFALAVPSVLSLLVLLRNEAARGIAGTKLEWVRARVEEQCKLLEGGLPLTFPLDALMVTLCFLVCVCVYVCGCAMIGRHLLKACCAAWQRSAWHETGLSQAQYQSCWHQLSAPTSYTLPALLNNAW